MRFVQHIEKVQEVKTFPDGVAYTPKWLVDLRRQKGRKAARKALKKFMCLPTAEKIG